MSNSEKEVFLKLTQSSFGKTQRVISRRISSLRDIALCQLPTKEMKSKKNVVSTLNRNSKFGLVLFNWGG